MEYTGNECLEAIISKQRRHFLARGGPFQALLSQRVYEIRLPGKYLLTPLELNYKVAPIT